MKQKVSLTFKKLLKLSHHFSDCWHVICALSRKSVAAKTKAKKTKTFFGKYIDQSESISLRGIHKFQSRALVKVNS